MIPDKYQQKIIEEYCRTGHNLFISATAGAGKTSTLVELARRTPPAKSSIFLAFNKSIAEELKNRLPPTIRAQTIHGCAFAALKRAFNFKYTIKENKYYSIAEMILRQDGVHPKRIPSMSMQLCRMFDLIRFNLAFTVEEMQNVAIQYGEDATEEFLDRLTRLYGVAEAGWNQIFMGRVGTSASVALDFTDMLLFAVRYVPEEDFKKYSIVMVDECQDISSLQYRLILRLRTPKGRLIAVGDERQAIYGFQGSNLNSLKAIQQTPNTVTLPLSMTYRCARAIVEEACRVFPDSIEASPTAPAGTVRHGGWVKEATDGDFVLCRNNAPLIRAWLTLVKRGQCCHILGKEFGDNLISLIDGVSSVTELDGVLLAMLATLRRKGYQHPERCEPYVQLEEKITVILDLYDYFGSLAVVRDRIYDIFVENTDNSGVTLSTIHKSKGLEADRVFILEPNLIPSRFATTEQDFYAEKCLLFVAITRARKELIYID